MNAEEFAICHHALCAPILIAWKSRIILTFHIRSLNINSSSLPLPLPFLSSIFLCGGYIDTWEMCDNIQF